MSGIYQIDKLEEGNYDSWSIQMRSVLVHSELWSVASGEASGDVTASDVPEGARAKDEKALAMITLCVKTSQLGYIKKNCKKSAEAWKKLKDVHQPSGPVRKVQLYKKLLSKRMDQRQSISSYINEFIDILDGLSSVRIDLNDELRTIVLLSSLPEHYENFVVAIETRDSRRSMYKTERRRREKGKFRRTKGMRKSICCDAEAGRSESAKEEKQNNYMFQVW
ncbi:uncharacterized protein LOC121404001 [Drosophila obscura]|uniref:uncharacterized protein LOC121404001 n=1 Tax=Drosophila obscura TaxID=7282 RepID=UPI001BB0F058|nr:uncharacterized protein LOC121404001 [Drosophila obscura]